MNTEMRALSDALLTLVNASQIPIEAKRLILENLLIKVTEKSEQIIAEEIKAKETKDGSNETEDL